MLLHSTIAGPVRAFVAKATLLLKAGTQVLKRAALTPPSNKIVRIRSMAWLSQLLTRQQTGSVSGRLLVYWTLDRTRLREGTPETITSERGPRPSNVHLRRKFFLTREHRFSLNDLGNATVEAMQLLTHQRRSVQLPLGTG